MSWARFIISGLMAFATIMLTVWAMLSFVEMSISPKDWNWFSRLVFITVAALAGAGFSGAAGDRKDAIDYLRRNRTM